MAGDERPKVKVWGEREWLRAILYCLGLLSAYSLVSGSIPREISYTVFLSGCVCLAGLACSAKQT